MKILGALLIAAFVGIVGYRLAYPTLVYRFRITVSVETPQGEKTGSGVMEVRHISYPAWITLGNNTGATRLIGEAVFVDLGAGGDGRRQNLVALLALGKRGEYPDFYLLPTKAFEPFWKNNSSLARGTAWAVATLPVGTHAALHGDLIPTLVTFADEADPNTVRVVPANNIGSVFGQGFALKSVEIEIVPMGIWPLTLLGVGGDPITRKIETVLPWIARLKSDGLGDRIQAYPDRFTINVPYFTRR